VSKATVVGFGPFVFDRQRRNLRRGQQPVPLGGRALDLLDALIDKPGTVLSRSELEASVWPRARVEETSLRVQVSTLRRALDGGEDYVASVPGRGYCFVAPVTPLAVASEPQHPGPGNLPSLPGRVLGRDAVIDDIGRLLQSQRLVCLLGTSGMGKTMVAIAAAHALRAQYPDGVWYIDFTGIDAQTTASAVVAATLGVEVSRSGQEPTGFDAIREQRVLLVLDHFEDRVADFASCVSTLLDTTSNARCLAVGIRAPGTPLDWVYRLPPLRHAEEDDNEALSYFVEQARALDDRFTLREATRDLVIALCRRLDGVPLAIELAAIQAGVLGVQAVHDGLDDALDLLNRGRREAMPRHRNLRAMLEWSCERLPPRDRTVLQRLSVFPASFDIEQAVQLATGESLDAEDVVDAVQDLVAASVLSVERYGGRVRYRMSGALRVFSGEKLEAADRPVRYRRLATLTLARLEGVKGAHGARTPLEPISEAERRAIDTALAIDLRAALDWSGSPDGDLPLCIQLAATGTHWLINHGLADEFAPRLQALARRAHALTPQDPQLELRARIAAGLVGTVARWTGDDDDLARTSALTDSLQGVPQVLVAQTVAIDAMVVRGDYVGAMQRVRTLQREPGAMDDRSTQAIADWMGLRALHGLGYHDSAMATALRLLAEGTLDRRHRLAVGIDPVTSLHVVVARAAWMTGRGTLAQQQIELARQRARETGPAALSHLLGYTVIAIALWDGDEPRARDAIAELQSHATQYRQTYWSHWAHDCARLLALRTSTPEHPLLEWHCPGAVAADHRATFLASGIDPLTLRRAQTGASGWAAAEVVRAWAEREWRAGRMPLEDAEQWLAGALDMARTQRAAPWELRAALSLHRMGTMVEERAHTRLAVRAALERSVSRQSADALEAQRVLDASRAAG